MRCGNIVTEVGVCYLYALMSKIYEALRRHEQNLVADQAMHGSGAEKAAIDSEPDDSAPPPLHSTAHSAEDSRRRNW